MSIKSYLTQPSGLLTIILFFIFLFAVLFLIYKKFPKIKQKKQVSLEVSSIKNAKKIIAKNKLKNHICNLHILEGALSKALQIDYLSKDSKLINLSDNMIIVICNNTNEFSLLVSDSYLQNLERINAKLKLKFDNINIHYELAEHIVYDEEVFKTINTLDTSNKKNIIINFYTQSPNDDVAAFNTFINKENFYKLSQDGNNIENLINFLSSKVVKSKESIKVKHSCILLLSRMQLLLKKIYIDQQNSKSNFYLYFLLNTKNNFVDHSVKVKLRHNVFLSPLNITMSVASLCLSIIFLFNIVNELKFRNELNLINYSPIEGDLDSLRLHIKNIEAKIDNNIILSSLYPKSIKYSKIYIQYANILAKNEIIPTFLKVNNISSLTAFLIYFTHLSNTKIDAETSKMITIMTKFSHIPKEDLVIVLKYSGKETRSYLIETAIKKSKELFYKESFNASVENIQTFENFEKKYLGISNPERVKVIYNSLEAGINKCTTQNLLSLLKDNNEIPYEFNYIFNIYKKETQKINFICNSTFMETIAADISMIDNYLPALEITDFQEFIVSVSLIVGNIEKSGDSLKGKDSTSYERFNKFAPVLVQYAVNTITSLAYTDTYLPLIDNVNKDLFIGFKPNFYDNSVYISPLYSQEHIEYGVIPVKQNFEELSKKLKTKYNIDTSFITSIYSEALQAYISEYINNFVDIIKELNATKIDSLMVTSNKSLVFYLISMSSKESPFNNFIDYYRANTSVNIEGFESIRDYFKDNDDFLNSEKYSEYRDIFLKLKNVIAAEGYANTYKKIKQGYKPLEKVYSDLAELKSTKNNSLYILLKNHLDIATKAIENIAVNNSIKSLEKNVEAEYFYLNNFLPFNFSSDKVLSNKELIAYIGDSGSVYLPFKQALEPLLIYDKINNLWYNPSFTTSKQKKFLEQFNKIFVLNSLLLNKDGSPNSLELDITPIPSNDYNYTFSSILINKDFVNSLNVEYSQSTTILYNWSAKDPVSIILKLDNGETIQKNYSGDWALIKAIKDAKCNDNVCTWSLDYKGNKYPVTFKVQSRLLEIIES